MDAKTEIFLKLQQDVLLWQGFKPQAGVWMRISVFGGLSSLFLAGVFPKRAIHEFITISPQDSAASDGFIAGLISVLMDDGAACVWVSTARRLFPACLSLFNVAPERIIHCPAKY